jgi:hypothetical protein|tara:strand:- start:8498 stop:9301 length:804 start_codon:yes stop_codon:yes gene_type:complete
MKQLAKSNFSPSTGLRSQSGAVLIVVLLVLILIMIVGAIAVRQSTTDLKVATADQVNKLLFQANDAALMKVEKEDRILSQSQKSRDTLNQYMSEAGIEGNEISFCVRPRGTKLFSILEISKRNENGGLESSNGFCNPANDADYVSEGRLMTQMTFVRPISSDTENVLNQEAEGTSSNDLEKPNGNAKGSLQCTTFIGYTTSVVPALSKSPLGNAASTGTDTVAGCLKQPRTGTNTVDTCLTALNVPFQTQQQTYSNQSIGPDCITSS